MGCQDPVFQERQALRDERVQQMFVYARELDGWRLATMDRTWAGAGTLREQRIEHLEETWNFAEEVEQRRRLRNRNQPFYRDHWFKFIPEGHPELIAPVFADMVY